MKIKKKSLIITYKNSNIEDHLNWTRLRGQNEKKYLLIFVCKNEYKKV